MNDDHQIDPTQAATQACGNCGTALLGSHCWRCGQPVKGLVRPLSNWIVDALDTVFNYDGRLWRTLAPLLLRPGFLSREYIAGRRVRYVTPVRLLLFLTVLLFLAVRLLVDINPGNGGSDHQIKPHAADVPRIERLIQWLPEAERRATLEDALSPWATPMDAPVQQSAVVTPEESDVRLRWLPAGANELLQAGVMQMRRNIERLNADPAAFVDQMLSVAPQTLFIVLPLFALLLKLFYAFSGRMYMEHLLVAMHSHSFMALNLLLIVLLNWLGGVATASPWLTTVLNWAQTALWIWIPVYLFATQKRVYGQGWWATSLKFALLGLLYLFLLTFGSVVVLLLGLLLW